MTIITPARLTNTLDRNSHFPSSKKAQFPALAQTCAAGQAGLSALRQFSLPVSLHPSHSVSSALRRREVSCYTLPASDKLTVPTPFYMMAAMTERFFENLEPFSQFSQFADLERYRPLPQDWVIVITDIESSTRAIEQGKYKQVNAVGVASITALIHAARPIRIPYVFLGDGVTACIPESLTGRARSALRAVQQVAWERFELKLRVGLVPMAEVRRQGCEVQVGKYEPAPHFQQAMLQGDGIAYAEKITKDKSPARLPDVEAEGAVGGDSALFDGFECRWNEIPSPHGENAALLVQALGASSADNHRIYTQILDEIRQVYGEDAQHHPLKESLLSLTTSNRLLSIEAGIRTAFQPPWRRAAYLFMLQIYRWIGTGLMSFGVRAAAVDWGGYKKDLVSNTDYRKFDQVLRMIISGTESQNLQLRAALERYRARGEIAYGIHLSPTALLTCVVANYNKDHVHFLDLSAGGYAMASQELKKQLGLA